MLQKTAARPAGGPRPASRTFGAKEYSDGGAFNSFHSSTYLSIL